MGRSRGFTLGFQAQLLMLLLAFGAIPLGLTITVGYAVSRTVILDQTQQAIRELGGRQARLVLVELQRQRLLLRTITGQLERRGERGTADWSELLITSLLDDGVFDGLRLVNQDDEIVSDVALRNAAPRWPLHAPAHDWESSDVMVHRSGDAVVAYVLAAPLMVEGSRWWLEGHVRVEDFVRLFELPLHLLGGVELGLFDDTGRAIIVPHPHSGADLQAALSVADSLQVVQAMVAGLPSFLMSAPVPEVGWTLGAFLPLEAALAPMVALRTAALLGCGLVVLFIVLTANAASRDVTRPLRELALAARDFGRTGSYGSVRHRGVAETDALVTAFHQMAATVTQSRREIERFHAQELERAQQLATVGELASGIAHEIRNPLTGVLGALELASGKIPPGDSTRPLLEESRRQLRRIETATTQLLQYARPPELREIVVDAHLLVMRAAQIVEARFQQAGIELRVEKSASPALVSVDPELLVQVLVNLMLNAVEVLQAPGLVTVGITEGPTGVRISVSDTGPGVPAELRSDIFRPFFTTKHQGTGLGLSISQQIVKRHGGTLSLVVTADPGATFVVALPRPSREGARGD